MIKKQEVLELLRSHYDALYPDQSVLKIRFGTLELVPGDSHWLIPIEFLTYCSQREMWIDDRAPQWPVFIDAYTGSFFAVPERYDNPMHYFQDLADELASELTYVLAFSSDMNPSILVSPLKAHLNCTSSQALQLIREHPVLFKGKRRHLEEAHQILETIGISTCVRALANQEGISEYEDDYSYGQVDHILSLLQEFLAD